MFLQIPHTVSRYSSKLDNNPRLTFLLNPRIAINVIGLSPYLVNCTAFIFSKKRPFGLHISGKQGQEEVLCSLYLPISTNCTFVLFHTRVSFFYSVVNTWPNTKRATYYPTCCHKIVLQLVSFEVQVQCVLILHFHSSGPTIIVLP